MKHDLSKVAFRISLVLAAFSYGVACAHWGLFPYKTIVAARAGITEIVAHWKSYTGREPTRWLAASPRSGTGVTVAMQGRYQVGVNFVSTLLDGDIVLALLRTDGTVMHRWPVRYLDLWSRADQESMNTRPLKNWDVGVMGAALLPDGSVIFTFNSGGLVKLDWCGQIVWKHAYLTHHSVFIADDGSIWAASVKAIHARAVPNELRPLQVPLVEDAIVHLDARGNLLRMISIPGLLLKNHLEGLLLANGVTSTTNLTDDYTHLNRVAVLRDSEAPQFPMFSAGDLLVSLRNLNLVLVIDPRTESVKWFQTGPWLRQHDAIFAPDGRISVFDNHTDNAGGAVFGGSRIVSMDPASRSVSTIFGASPSQALYSDVEGEHVYLANGDLLISEAMGGRLLEADRSGNVVWEYVNRYDSTHVVAETHAYGRIPEGQFEKAMLSCSR